MKLSETQMKTLLIYTGLIQIKQLALNMALTRFKGLYSRNPSADTLRQCTNDFNAILEKYSGIMKEDFDWIIKL